MKIDSKEFSYVVTDDSRPHILTEQEWKKLMGLVTCCTILTGGAFGMLLSLVIWIAQMGG